ncbi:MAG: hypothetical protein ACI4NG_06430 [Candidatus Gallimonas sp.]
MPLDTLEKIRTRKPFAPLDLLVYLFLAVAIVTAIVALAVGARGERARGIELFAGEERVCTFSFSDGLTVGSGWEDFVTVQTGETTVLTVYFDEARSEYNRLEIDLSEGTVVMADATCSRRRDCTHMAPIRGGSGVIVCLPHDLKVMAIGGDEFANPVLG